MATITTQQAIGYARNAGFTGSSIATIVAIAWAESSLNTTVVNSIGATGILQIYLAVHPDVTSSQAKDPAFSFQYAYRLSGGGSNFRAWEAYTNGSYLQFIPRVQQALTVTTGRVPITNPNRVDGNGNPFAGSFGDQCTYWAQKRYHDLTGIWTPCTGNGYQWASQAAANGWIVSSQPPTNQPSVICLQPGVQLSDRNFGHVGVVERVNSDGSVYTSNYNVYPHIGDKVTVYVTFRTGNGVSFIYAGQNIGSLNNLIQFTSFIGNNLNTLNRTYTLSSNATIADALIALDNLMLLQNPFDNINAKEDSLGVISFTDPVSWMQGLGQNLVSDMIALTMRSIFLVLGIFLLFKVLDHFVNFSGMAQQAGQAVEKVLPLLLMA